MSSTDSSSSPLSPSGAAPVAAEQTSPHRQQIHYKVMSKDYNKFSKIQLAAILRMLEILATEIFPKRIDFARFFDFVTLPSGEISYSFRISDYGCASGKNSLYVMKALHSYLIQVLPTSNASFNFHAFLLDLPTNDFNKIFQVFQEEQLQEGKVNGFYLSTSAGNLYEQSLPPQSVHVSCSFTALHWLSAPIPRYGLFSNPECCYISSADPSIDALLIDHLLQHSHSDLERYFLARKTEVKVGGLVFFTCLGYDSTLFPTKQEEEDFIAGRGNLKILPCIHRTGRLLGKLLYKTREQFNLPNHGSTDLFLLPMIPHSKEDVVKIIGKNPNLQSSYEILYNDIYDVGDAYAKEGLTEEELITMRCGSTRGYSESSVRELLGFNQEAVEWFYEQLYKCMKEDKQYLSHDTGMLMTVLRRIQ